MNYIDTRPWRHIKQTRAWKKLRLIVLREEPLCRYCKQAGKTTPANTVDHIEPHKGNERLFFDRKNLQALCADCHNSAKALQEKHGHAPGCDEEGFPLDDNHLWNK